MKILLIEDEPELRKSIKMYLHQEGYIVESAEDFRKASDKLKLYDYDCILVDINLPYGSGLDIVRDLKDAGSKAGIIIISAKDSSDDKVEGLDLGADDYLAKPFSMAELNSRIRALIRRKNFEGNKVIALNEITVIPDQHSVKVHNESVSLTAKEFDLLMFFISNKNRVLSKGIIAEHLWGDYADQMDNHDFIYVHLRNLRKKLIEKGCTDYIQTVYAAGYIFKLQ